MNKRILRVSGIFMAGAAALFLASCTTAGSQAGYYDDGYNQNAYVTFQQANPDEVRYAITRDMYMQGYYLANGNNLLVFERPLAGYRDMERVTFWLEMGYGGTRVMVDQLYFIYSGNGWRESRNWRDPYRPLFMQRHLHDFHREYYRQPRGYWQYERERDRNRDWTRRDERQRWERDESRGGRRPALPPAQTQEQRKQELIERFKSQRQPHTQQQPVRPQQFQQPRQQMESPRQEQMMRPRREERQQPPAQTQEQKKQELIERFKSQRQPQTQQQPVRQKAKPQEAEQPQPQPSSPSQEQIDKVREKFRGKHPY